MVDKKFIWLIVGLIIIGGYGIYVKNKPTVSTKTVTENLNQAPAEFVEIPLSEISENMKKYTYDHKGIDVNYIVVLGSDGEIRTAFDACDVCGGYKGYRQQGEDVVCNNCGRHFKIDELGESNQGGGCWPSFLNHKIEGDKLLISTNELAQGAYRFA